MFPIYEIVYPSNDKTQKPVLIEWNDDAKTKQFHKINEGEEAMSEGYFVNLYDKAAKYAAAEKISDAILKSHNKLEDIIEKYFPQSNQN